MVSIERTKNAFRNIFYGLILKLYQMLVPFFMRTVIIYVMGIQYLGLNSLFTSILQVLNLAELGIGSAMVYSMYKPIAEDDRSTICALMNLYKMYYRIIGGIIAIIGLILTPFIPKLINGEIPSEINIYILYLLNLGATVLSYWLFSYKGAIIQAYQRTDIISKITLATNTIQYLLQMIILFLLKNYYLYVFIMLITQAFTNIITAICANRFYPDLNAKGKLASEDVKQINQRIKDLFTAKIGTVVVGSVDTIIISFFLGLTTLAVYQNYYFIMNAMAGFITVIFNAITAGIGNSLITETEDKNYDDFKILTFIICFILCVFCCCFANLYQPFMKLWVGEQLMLGYKYVIMFCALFYCLELAMIWATVKDAAGLWHSDRYRPLIGAIANLVMNIIMVKIIGLSGVILSTILSYLLISMPWLIHNLFKYLYKRSLRNYLKDLFIYVLMALFFGFLTVHVCSFVKCSGILEIIIKGLVSCIISVAGECLIFCKKKEFQASVALVKSMMKRG